MIHHYTTIETLALILKNKSIRFNRLDKVDDLEEGCAISNNINLSKYVLVSCWTESSDENIPLWKLYANGANGVKISVEKDLFEEYGIKDGKDIVVKTDGFIIPLNEQIYGQCNFIPCKKDSDFFYRKIKYVPDIKTEIKGMVNFTEKYTLITFDKVGSYKHKRWEFQNESRFVLTATPRIEGIGMLHPMFSTMTNNCLRENIDLPFDDYYLKIKDSALDKLIVTLCPSATNAQKIIVESLIKEYAPNATVKMSSLSGCVNLK